MSRNLLRMAGTLLTKGSTSNAPAFDARMLGVFRSFSSASQPESPSTSSARPSLASRPGFEAVPPAKLALIERILSDSCASARELRKKRLVEIMEKFQRHDRDCGSSEVQIARMTVDLEVYDGLLRTHQRKNFHLKAFRQRAFFRRARLLRYLRREDFPRYYDVIKSLGLEDDHAELTYHQRYLPKIHWKVVEEGIAAGLSRDEIMRRLADKDKEEIMALKAKGLHPIPPSVPRSRAGFAPRRPPSKRTKGRI